MYRYLFLISIFVYLGSSKIDIVDNELVITVEDRTIKEIASVVRKIWTHPVTFPKHESKLEKYQGAIAFIVIILIIIFIVIFPVVFSDKIEDRSVEHSRAPY